MLDRIGWRRTGIPPAVLAVLASTLFVLLAHATHHRFLTDDAYISFRYARNLADGHGLVFNPGLGRVEGYTNFLWVVLLAAIDRFGAPPHAAADVLSLLATVGLWGLVAGYALRNRPERGSLWLVVFPVLALAVTRSVAVWSTSGLETRLFELLVVAGVLRLLGEVRRIEGPAERPRPLAAVLFALATLTRPDGLLIAVCAAAAAIAHLARRGRLDRRAIARSAAVYFGIVGAHVVFRLAYYGAWLPNTYYAKIGGRTWWDMGGMYLASFAIEYAVWLWVPLIVAGVAWHRRKGSTFVPVAIAAVVVPHAVYVSAIGGDHFEFRPLDLYFPLAFVLLYDGARQFARNAASRYWLPAYLAVVLVGLVALPLRSGREFPDTYVTGFPGQALDREAGAGYLDPQRDPLYRGPLRPLARLHRDLLRATTDRLVGVRREEHALFAEQMHAQAQRLAVLLASGALPRDLRLALACVGIVPYTTDLPVLDRYGLTDAEVARHGVDYPPRVMAHDRQATLEQARDWGVEIWTVNSARPTLAKHDPFLMAELHKGVSGITALRLADLGDGHVLAVLFPVGDGNAARRFPELEFRAATAPGVAGALFAEAEAYWRRRIEADPRDADARWSEAQTLFMRGDVPGAARRFHEAGEAFPGETRHAIGLALALADMGRLDEALAALDRALAVARRRDLRPHLGALERLATALAEDRDRRRGIAPQRGSR